MITILISGNNGSIVLAIVGNWLEIVGGGLKREVIDPGWSGEFKKKKYYGKRENVYFVVLYRFCQLLRPTCNQILRSCRWAILLASWDTFVKF
ncbi:hypothetical protein T4B_12609 [Trichinella pseudospiralis]|uniref:Uncharacterized protein n=1 Tax=Trichinella pseudospiralis TaxID=6337 RepID=A0A0V1K3H2_TRIPS|nr:hypothetical protein T4E_10455 [Trichinella pseudospiralis]KRZ19538.1 hypothetical protein T4B_12609 [Trichinella pseudospiralis]KRZ41785.1 hypothetical protein T4C_1234 [Trichinella pseudospiralis]